MLYHTSIDAMLETNFSLMQHHKWSLSEVESMIPWEREVYTTFLMQYLEELKQKQEQAKRK